MSTNHEPTPSPLRRLFGLLALERQEIANLYVYGIVVGLFSLIVPLAVQSLIGLVSGGMLLQPAVLLILFVTLGSAFSGWLQLMQVYVMERIQQHIFVRAAFTAAQQIPRWRLEALAQRYYPEVANRFFDVLNVQKGVAKLLTDFFTAFLQFCFGLLLLTFYHPYFIVFGLILSGLLMLLFRATSRRAMDTSLQESKYKYKVAAWLQSLAYALPATRLIQPKHTMTHTDELVSGYLKNRQAHFKVLRVQYASLFVFKTLVIGGLLSLGSYLVTDRQISLGQFVASELVVIMVLGAVEKIVLNLDTVYDLLTGLEKLSQLTEAETQNQKGYALPAQNPATGIALHAQGLGFDADTGQLVMQAANLEVAPGATVGILADNMEHARELLRLLCGLHIDYNGILTYDGIGLRDITPDSLQQQVGACLGLNAIYAGSLAANLHPQGDECNPTAMQLHISKLGLTDALQQLPDGLAQQLLPGGRGLDDRLAWGIVLSRTLMAQPRLLLIAYALDQLPQLHKQQAIAHVLQQPGSTKLIATNDPAVLQHCHQVWVLRNSNIQTYDQPQAALAAAHDLVCHQAAATSTLVAKS